METRARSRAYFEKNVDRFTRQLITTLRKLVTEKGCVSQGSFVDADLLKVIIAFMRKLIYGAGNFLWEGEQLDACICIAKNNSEEKQERIY
jgi:hypothetical protein